MAHYFVGDVQGCFAELSLLLQKVDFNPSTDELWAVGDLIARGSESLATLRFFKSLDNSAKIVLGNHDLHLLALHGKLKRPNPQDNLAELLNASDINSLTDWIRQQPLVRTLPEHNIIMTHAGVPPQWDVSTLLQEAEQVSTALQQHDYLTALIAKMYTEDSQQWSSDLAGIDRLRYCINALTRMRFLYPDGRLDFKCKTPPQQQAHASLKPWFEFPSRCAPKNTLVFGHWAALMGQTNHPHYMALDTGCCWGEHLTLWHLEKNEKITQKRLI
ncbi:symmetrical bis(5'-nucleosyl)-tetraphosphatase [Shewanella inventionis]|uniref:Bis(5'-nucleosyl)-tetraphosphatase, symmetrical n=1 Tax=Shewanella inventionis TaxID=1738770 RepID=A0ABQ1J709_9GAMM|nr:symmetrical bis(5'-nucleosyl)-tetraphosphatase [Shewanella inventionis]MCL1158704.1 symmetrical bis(5'-nucleosyl)-tetraphosphatase [Shewanella inventionis]UAL42891.1 symmetrical bis(5'-nucleosyl)-tetraphosphatase [Shewanella inventionis]GGB61338.1 bis(5'-nucleosyl)-tetraphosphatase, symmetrical [Shewanella inventionis]